GRPSRRQNSATRPPLGTHRTVRSMLVSFQTSAYSARIESAGSSFAVGRRSPQTACGKPQPSLLWIVPPRPPHYGSTIPVIRELTTDQFLSGLQQFDRGSL